MTESASPQLENGHTRIANELLEVIVKYPFCATELKIVLFIIRKTYGWRRKKVIVSYGVISKSVKGDIRHIKRLINKLIKDRVLIKEKSEQQNLFGLNKDYKAWRLWKTNKAGGEETTTSVVS